MNRAYSQNHPGENELDARIFISPAMDALDLSKEPESVRKLYGLDNPLTAAYGTRCLMARGVEAGDAIRPDFRGKELITRISSRICTNCARRPMSLRSRS